MSTEYCPRCHQPLGNTRMGVRLPPTKMAIVDVVARAGPDGITIDDINHNVFDGDANPVTIRTHIQQINQDYLHETDFIIKGDGASMRGFYRIVKKAK